MFNHWVEDHNENVELIKNQSYLVGSFINPEAARKLMDKSNTISVSDEEFDKFSKELFAEKKEEDKPRKRKRRKAKKG